MKNQSHKLIVIVAMFLLVPFWAFADEIVPEDDITPKEAVQIVKEEMASDLPASEGTLKKDGAELTLEDEMPTDGDIVTLPVQATGEIKMESAENGQVKIGLPDDGSAGKATMVNSSTVVYPNTGEGVDTVVSVPSSKMIETYHIIRSVDSPTKYEYKLTIPEGGKLQKTEEGYVVIIDAEGLPIMTVTAPSAKDTNEKPVPLHLDIENGSVVLTVEHDASFAYPIVADPTYYGIEMTDAEVKFCKKPWNWNNCYKVGFTLKNEATNVADSVWGKYRWDKWKGGSDAVRHCYWSGRMAQEFGVDEAKGFGDRHEDTDAPNKPKKPNTKDKKKLKNWENDVKEWEKKYKEWEDDKNMDLKNNSKGRSWAFNGKGSLKKDELKERCIKGVTSGELKRLQF